ncbi:cell division cycle 7-related protein kinase-like [Gigantopelta aegis]|uniref:cell division cycle 7-related protein kinase-like n=1 Tax=Gigantopelta aegis TaxID=1735272 RepID=UPI001B889416|nr:cell division cycle 7-related protein kinase-like [Gigantopelta aegis]
MPLNMSLASKTLPIDVQEEIDCLYEFVPEVSQHFRIIEKIGEGTFSSVFRAKLKCHPQVEEQFALKHIIPTSHPTRIEGELRCLQQIGGCENVIGVELCIRNKDHVVIVMPYFAHDYFQDYIQEMTLSEVREYMRNLLIALRRVHQFDIIHRDVKPTNFLYNRTTKRFALVDFGLAHEAPVLKKIKQSSKTVQKDLNDTDELKKVLRDMGNIPSVSSLSQSVKKETPIKKETPLSKADPKSKPVLATKQYTPSPTLDSLAFTKRMKSPRRLLLSKRTLMIKDEHGLPTKTRPSTSSTKPGVGCTCQCFNQPMICRMCMARANQIAPRAGTPGFRSPEVLLKCPDQSTAVDIWSAGVIFLSLLSGRYPFFRAVDDVTALAQIATIMGSDPLKTAAKSFGKQFMCSPNPQPVDLRTLCHKLRSAPPRIGKHHSSKTLNKENFTRSWTNIPKSAFDLLHRLLDLNPGTRITAEEALEEAFFTECI